MESISPFDWHRIFLGDEPLLFLGEVAFRTGFMYLFTVYMARLIGKRGMGQITPFEFIIVIVLGSAAGDPMLYPHVPLVHGMVVITTIVVMERVFAELTQRLPWIEHFVDSKPTRIIEKGKINEEILQGSSFSKESLLMKLREQGIDNLGQVRRAYLEPSGKVSVFKYSSPTIISETTDPHTTG